MFIAIRRWIIMKSDYRDLYTACNLRTVEWLVKIVVFSSHFSSVAFYSFVTSYWRSAWVCTCQVYAWLSHIFGRIRNLSWRLPYNLAQIRDGRLTRCTRQQKLISTLNNLIKYSVMLNMLFSPKLLAPLFMSNVLIVYERHEFKSRSSFCLCKMEGRYWFSRLISANTKVRLLCNMRMRIDTNQISDKVVSHVRQWLSEIKFPLHTIDWSVTRYIDYNIRMHFK